MAETGFLTTFYAILTIFLTTFYAAILCFLTTLPLLPLFYPRETAMQARALMRVCARVCVSVVLKSGKNGKEWY
jgi:hypothetical protein